mmetsp:Transcript_41580/g.117625  ORF Transcript_41580/g.117625 Transcript_41580/m.117625 type:complete len:234 (-) Transcript_41580:398-1099(-)
MGDPCMRLVRFFFGGRGPLLRLGRADLRRLHRRQACRGSDDHFAECACAAAGEGSGGACACRGPSFGLEATHGLRGVGFLVLPAHGLGPPRPQSRALLLRTQRQRRQWRQWRWWKQRVNTAIRGAADVRAPRRRRAHGRTPGPMALPRSRRRRLPIRALARAAAAGVETASRASGCRSRGGGRRGGFGRGVAGRAVPLLRGGGVGAGAKNHGHHPHVVHRLRVASARSAHLGA